MFRSLALLCFAAVFALSTAFAQNESDTIKIKATPDILSLLDESRKSLSQAAQNSQVSGLFRLLGLAVNFDDKAPAQKITDALLLLAPSIEPAELRNQLYEGIANALCDMEKYPEAVEILNRIVTPDDRSESQLNIAARIVLEHEQDKTLAPFDASALLRQAVGSAVELKNITKETLSRALLGQELARQGKQEESAAALTEAIKAAQKIEEAEEQGQIIGMIFQCQVNYGQMVNAVAAWQAVTDPEIKRASAFALVSALIQHKKFAEAEQVLKAVPAGEMKDVLLHNFVLASIETITDAKIGEFSALVSSDERRERFLQIITNLLQKTGRGDAAAQVSKRLKEPAVAEMSLFIGKVESLLEKNQFAEAIRFVDESEENEAIRQHLKRQILMTQYSETYDETVAEQIEATFTSSEKIAVTELRTEAKRTTEVADLTERIDVLLEIFQEQSRFLDFTGARQTLKLVAEQLDKGTEPVQIVRDRLLLARLQTELRDKEGAKANLGKLMQTLSAVKDLKELNDLVPTQPPGTDVESTVDESAIQNQLFQIYLMTASLLARVDAPTESQSAFAKARELAKMDSDAVQKAEKLLILAQFLADEQK